MTRRRAHFERALAERDPIAVLQHPVRSRGATCFGQRNGAADPVLEQPRAGHVIGVDVGFERPQEPEPQLRDQGRVAADLLEHWVDHHRLAGDGAAQQVRVGRRRGVEKLTEDQHQGALALSMAATSAASSLTLGEAIRSFSCCRLVALTIGAVIDFLCISQARVTWVGLELCFLAASSSAFSTPMPLGLMYFFTPAPRWALPTSPSERYLPDRKPLASE